MGKSLFATAIVLAFAAPAGLSLASPARSPEITAPCRTGGEAADPVASTARAAAPIGWAASPEAGGSPVRRPGPVGRVLVDIDDVLNAVRPQESALAVLFEVDRPDRPDAAREREELDLRLRRHRDAPAFRRDA